MVIRTTRPVRRKNSTQAQFVRRIPADLRAAAKGKSVRITLPALDGGAPEIIFPKAGAVHIGFSLRAPVGHAAVQRRHAAAGEQIAAWFDALRQGPRPLSNQQKTAVAGEAYKAITETLAADPILSWPAWGLLAHAQREELQVNPLLIGAKAAQDDLTNRLEARYGGLVDAMLRRLNLIVTSEDRHDIIQRVARHAPEAALKLADNADDDYRPDDYAKRFPPADVLVPPRPTADTEAAVSWSTLIANWKKTQSPRPKTVREWERIVKDFAAYTGKADAAAVLPRDVRAWRDHLRERLEISGINKTQIAALKALFNAAVREELLQTNPATGTTLRDKKSAKTKMRGHSDLAAGRILQSALREKKALLRWAPWLLAQSGARAGEVCQLRGNDFELEDGQAFFWIRHDVKTGVARRVPVHPELLRQGIMEFASQRGSLPLFYEPEKRKGESPHRVLVKDLARWVSRTGIEVGRIEHRKDPNHGWRHWLITTLRRHEVQSYVIQAIVGHSGGGVTGSYGEVPLRTMAKAIRKLPLAALLASQAAGSSSDHTV